jgi:hypothetical protein
MSPTNTQNLPQYPLDNLLYLSGLTAQGGWDELDAYQRDCVVQLVQFTARRCAILAEVNPQLTGQEVRDLIHDHFGLE